jgi:hypothetical protein
LSHAHGWTGLEEINNCRDTGTVLRLTSFIKKIGKNKWAWDGRTCCGREGDSVHIHAPSLERRSGEKIFSLRKKRA